MLFLHADFWPLFWGVIGGGAGLTGLLSLFATSLGRGRRRPVPVPAEVAPRRAAPAAAPARAA
ncbi:MAG TPA: hypothetical protein VH089_18275 [Streptosporangiaceae bacterium]|nr:hypothetical protein [Streptosporangiaceae bacterium]